METDFARLLLALVVGAKVDLDGFGATALCVLQRRSTGRAAGVLLAERSVLHLVMEFNFSVELG